MYKSIIAVTVILSLNVNTWADYPADRKAAMELVKVGKNEEALSAFDKMAKDTVDEAQKSDALEQASMCASRLKKYDQAIGLAGQIPQIPMSKTVQMRIMLDNGKASEILTKFKDEAIADWPSKAAGEASYYRGVAYYQAKDGKNAEVNLKNALKNLEPGYTADQTKLTLADNYQNNLKDDQRALTAYLEAEEKATMAFGWIRLQSIVSASEIFRRQNRYDEALKILDKADVNKLNGHWRITVLGAYGETLASHPQGKKAEAAGKFKEALAVKGITEAQKASYEKRLAELQADSK